ncbi:MAG: S8 family serine peptidase [Bacteroidota bacterium]
MKSILLCFLIGGQTGLAQTKYWVFLDSEENQYQLSAQPALSSWSQKNRLTHGIRLDDRDYPIPEDLLLPFWKEDIPILTKSRWLKAVSVRLNEKQLHRVAEWPMVKKILPVARGSRIARIASDCPNVPQQGTHWRQLNMIGLDVLHRNGWTGEGIRIAVFDNGFYQVDHLEAFEHVFEEGRMIATRDFVSQQESVFDSCLGCTHGTNVFSLLAARMPGQLIGAAPHASYLLFRTENDSSETNQEEDNWIAAAEYADSIGAEIFTSSLGYNQFDSGQVSYTRSDLDGQTAMITLAADIAASKGMLVLTSAGNEGGLGVTVPADGKEVLAIGAVDECEEYAPFSSRGPSADGRIKPDLSAMGDQILMLGPEGRIKQGLGTSLATPLVAGLAACLWQAFPGASRIDIAEALRQSASQADRPDNRLGYGIPHGERAFQWLNTLYPDSQLDTLQKLHYRSPFLESDFLMYPTPNDGKFYLAYAAGIGSLETEVRIEDLLGRTLFTLEHTTGPGETQQLLDLSLNQGVYLIRIIGKESGRLFFSRKFIVNESQ